MAIVRTLMNNVRKSSRVARNNLGGRGAGGEPIAARRTSTARSTGVGSGFFDRVSHTAKWGYSNFRSSFGEGSTAWDVAKGVGSHMVRGAVGGGIAGGVMESAQGGSFWSGATSGAWNGAMAWGAWRSLGRATGATSRRPFAGGQGVLSSGATMWRSSSPNPRISKQAQALINQNQRDGLARMANGLR